MRIASYNVENMFLRPKAFDQATGKGNREVLEAYSNLTELLEKRSYAKDRKQILKLLGKLGLRKSDSSEYAELRRPRGKLLLRRKGGRVELVPKGRGDWIGWVELKKDAVNEQATRNTAAVIADVNADVLAVVEAENRPALTRFNENVLELGFARKTRAWRYRHVMLVDGNDERGIDVGLMTKKRFPIERVRSHVDDATSRGTQIFSRDCPEFEVALPGGGSLLMLVNHFKSKGYGSPASSNAKRKRQAEQVAAIYKRRRRQGWDRIVVAGDLNDTPGSRPLKPLIEETTLKDASRHPGFDWGERRGTYGGGNQQIDYMLLSPELYKAIEAGGVNRKGIWHGPRTRNPWQMLPTLTQEIEAASDHAAIWVELNL
jgi:endonuclease/exonuclease/phosphatase family metal-dependent hydrolase